MVVKLTVGFPFAITNHLGDVLFRSFAWKLALCTYALIGVIVYLRGVLFLMYEFVFFVVKSDVSTVEVLKRSSLCKFLNSKNVIKKSIRIIFFNTFIVKITVS